MVTILTIFPGDWKLGLAVLVHPELPFNPTTMLWLSSVSEWADWHTRMVVVRRRGGRWRTTLSGPRGFHMPVPSSQRLCCIPVSRVCETPASRYEASSSHYPPNSLKLV